MSQIKAQSHRAGRQNLVMLDHLVFFARNCADDNGLNTKLEQVRDFVGDGLACGAAIHIEAVRKNQPDLFAAIAHA